MFQPTQINDAIEHITQGGLYQGVHFLFFSYFFLFFPIFPKSSYLFLFLLQNSYFFLFFYSFGIKHTYLQVCSYMTTSATVENFSPPAGASILHLFCANNGSLRYWSNSFETQGGYVYPSIPRSIMKHMCMYEMHICFLKIIFHQYINVPLSKKEKKGVLAYQLMILYCPIFSQLTL